MENNYTIYSNQLLEGQETEWKPYFENISYASGIKFLQNIEFVNVKFIMNKNQPVETANPTSPEQWRQLSSWGL